MPGGWIRLPFKEATPEAASRSARERDRASRGRPYRVDCGNATGSILLLPQTLRGLGMMALGFLAVFEAAAAEPPQPPRMLFLGEGSTIPEQRAGSAPDSRSRGRTTAPSPSTIHSPRRRSRCACLMRAEPCTRCCRPARTDCGLEGPPRQRPPQQRAGPPLTRRRRPQRLRAGRSFSQGGGREDRPLHLSRRVFRQGDVTGARDAVRTWRGYNGSQMEYQRLKSGRLLVPHGSMIPHAKAVPPTGRQDGDRVFG